MRIPDEAADKIAEYERALAGLGKDANDRVFGLVDRRRDHVLVVLHGCWGCLRSYGRVVVEIGMKRQKIIRKCLQGRRQALITRNRICPNRIAADRHDDTTRNRDLRVGVNEGDVGVPTIGTTAGRIDFQNSRAA